MKTSLCSLLLFSVASVLSQTVDDVSPAAQRPQQPGSPRQSASRHDHLQAWDEVLKTRGTAESDDRLADFLESLTHDEFETWSQLHHSLLEQDSPPVDAQEREEVPELR
ncbi:hypothetical protein FZEAL_3874 [Fusarium zealandicum]|uniref:Uncharacterized protein n=1 Tax=Fusarium zealandicum TaxID=1053134 RepID=A0A8H4UMS4_9HYPO|nr:hypothetical protein FZEAL_3874 [Fusarium zealandicum]